MRYGTSTTGKRFASGVIAEGTAGSTQRPERDAVQISEKTYQRMPANLRALFVKLPNPGSDEVLEVFPETVKGQVGMSKTQGGHRFIEGDTETVQKFDYGTTDSGSAARFFYCAKAKPAERWIYCRDCRTACPSKDRGKHSHGHYRPDGKEDWSHITAHPTVKPLDLMTYLCKLVCQPGYGGTLLDPFAGSGSTLLVAGKWFGRVIGIERDERYCQIAARRLEQQESRVSKTRGCRPAKVDKKTIVKCLRGLRASVVKQEPRP